MNKTPHLHTFSLVARDEKSGNICVGGTSHWFAYATLVPFIEAGVGAIATQAECNLSYGPEGLKMLKKGLGVSEVVERLTSKDEGKEMRQLLVIDAEGNTGGFTGNDCVDFADHYLDKNLAVAGNMLADKDVVGEIVDYYRHSKLPFELRVIKSLQQGQKTGGDIRGKRSAGLLVAEGEVGGDFWEGIIFDLRTDDNEAPLLEIERLYEIASAYQYMNMGDTEYYENKDKVKALDFYRKAVELNPKNPEMKFWQAKLLWDMGKRKQAKVLMKDVEKAGPQWVEYWQRVVGES